MKTYHVLNQTFPSKKKALFYAKMWLSKQPLPATPIEVKHPATWSASIYDLDNKVWTVFHDVEFGIKPKKLIVKHKEKWIVCQSGQSPSFSKLWEPEIVLFIETRITEKVCI